jgi:hypothetical protein
MRPIRPPQTLVCLVTGYSSLSWPETSFSSLRPSLRKTVTGAALPLANQAIGPKSTQSANASGHYQFQP